VLEPPRGQTKISSHFTTLDTARPMIAVNKRKAEMLLAAWVAKNYRPFAAVADPELVAFIKFMRETPGAFTMPAPSTIKTRVLELYNDEVARVQDLLATECDFYCITSDIWSSKKQDSYISVTIQYITETFDMRAFTLACVPFPGTHTASRIKTKIEDILEQWRLTKDKLTLFVRDGGSNMVRAAKDMQVRHMSCIAHSIHLCVALFAYKSRTTDNDKDDDNIESAYEENDRSLSVSVHAGDAAPAPPSPPTAAAPADVSWDELDTSSMDIDDERFEAEINDVFDEMLALEASGALDRTAGLVHCVDFRSIVNETHRVLSIVRKICTYFKNSPKAVSKLAVTAAMGGHAVYRAEIDVKTRWNSVCTMIAKVLRMKAAISAFMTFATSIEGRKEFPRLNLPKIQDDQWCILEGLLHVLEPFLEMTRVLMGTKYPTLAIMFPIIDLAQDDLARDDFFESVAIDPDTKISFASKFMDESYYADVLSYLNGVRSMLHHSLKDRVATIDEDLRWISLLVPCVVERPEYLDTRLTDECTRVAQRPATVEAGTEEPAKIQKVRSKYMQRLFQRDSMSQDRNERRAYEAIVQAEVRAYLLQEGASDGDPLAWWRLHRHKFPTIAQLARKWLGCSATSAQSERVFSGAGITTSGRRAALDPDTVNVITFLHDNAQ
jgi:hypothetical protein